MLFILWPIGVYSCSMLSSIMSPGVCHKSEEGRKSQCLWSCVGGAQGHCKVTITPERVSLSEIGLTTGTDVSADKKYICQRLQRPWEMKTKKQCTHKTQGFLTFQLEMNAILFFCQKKKLKLQILMHRHSQKCFCTFSFFIVLRLHFDIWGNCFTENQIWPKIQLPEKE